MTWDYYADPRPDIQRLVTAGGSRFLDVGCGSGELGAALKGSGAFVAGIELHSESAQRARERLDVFVEGDVLSVSLPFEEGEFDYIVFADVLEHMPDPEAVLARVLPYLKPDGRVVVSVPNYRFYSVLLRLIFDRWEYTSHGIRDRTHLRIFTRHVLVRLLEGAGLRVERLERNYRLIEDQTNIGRTGAVATRIARKTIAPLLFRNLMAYQYLAVACRSS